MCWLDWDLLFLLVLLWLVVIFIFRLLFSCTLTNNSGRLTSWGQGQAVSLKLRLGVCWGEGQDSLWTLLLAIFRRLLHVKQNWILPQIFIKCPRRNYYEACSFRGMLTQDITKQRSAHQYGWIAIKGNFF
jgi:hypothetical protein